MHTAKQADCAQCVSVLDRSLTTPQLAEKPRQPVMRHGRSNWTDDDLKEIFRLQHVSVVKLKAVIFFFAHLHVRVNRF